MDWLFYINYYPDLKKSGINNYVSAMNHWNKFGKKEGRISKIPYKNYILNYPDLKKAGILT